MYRKIRGLLFLGSFFKVEVEIDGRFFETNATNNTLAKSFHLVESRPKNS